MFDQFATDAAHTVARAIELVGIAIIALGAIGGLLLFAMASLETPRRADAVTQFRSNFGRSILLGLEFLIAADIINTVAVRPTLMSVAVLAGIVIIRTFLSFSLEVEIEGRWPWQRRRGDKREV
ncbi:MAG: DUF1622 domain-containing protein [Pseudomonadota bacterium]